MALKACCRNRSSSCTGRDAPCACCRWDASTIASPSPSGPKSFSPPSAMRCGCRARARASCRPRPTVATCGWSTRRWTPWRSRARTRSAKSSSSASALRPQCRRRRSPFCNHITIVPTIKAILDSPDLHLDAFLGPGHVSMVIGTAPYEFIARYYKKPMTIAGFEPLDVLQSIWMVLKQIDEGRCEIENQYARIVPEAGNSPALRAVAKVYELREYFEWRGLGSIDHS